jgi:hypothetical protein
VALEVERGPHYVGQAIELVLATTAGRERPEVVVPKLAAPDGRLIALGTEFQALSTSAIGDIVEERNRYTNRFWLVPARAGSLRLPPFRLRTGSQTTASMSPVLNIQRLPDAGRPATFLGGVGAVDVSAQVRPSILRVGQDIEYRILLTGPGALGSIHEPNLERLRKLPLELKIKALAPEETPSPPSRVFRYRIRPLRAGAATLPAVVVSWFDPKNRRYLSKASPALSVRVVDVDSFDPSSLRYEDGRQGEVKTELLGLAAIGAGGLMCAAMGAVWLRAQSRRKRTDPARLAARLVDSLNPGSPPDQVARAINCGLTAVLQAAVNRPAGALTPAEAGASMVQLTGREDLGEWASRLIAACDRSQFAGVDSRDAASQLVREGRELFSVLAATLPALEPSRQARLE